MQKLQYLPAIFATKVGNAIAYSIESNRPKVPPVKAKALGLQTSSNNFRLGTI